MTSFLSNVFLRATDPAHYKGLKQKTFYQATGYLFILLVLISYINTTMTMLELRSHLPLINRFIVSAEDSLIEIFPSDLVLTFKNGTLSSNKPEPLYLEVPEQWKSLSEVRSSEDSVASQEVQHLVAVDTNASIEEFSRYQSIALLTRTSAVTRGNNSSLKVIPLSKLTGDLVLDQAEYKRLVQRAKPFLDYLKPGFQIFMVAGGILWPWLASGFALVGYTLLCLACGLIIWLLSLLIWKDCKYSEVLVLTNYALTLPILLEFILHLTGASLPTGAFSLVLIIWMMMVQRNVRA